MWPLGHIAVAYLCYRLWARQAGAEPPTGMTLGVLIIASLLPDLIDKPLAWYGDILPAGRTLGHSLLFLLPLCVVVYLLARRWGDRTLGVAFIIGTISHVIVDALPVLWDPTASATFLLWPLLSVEPYADLGTLFTTLLREAFRDPWFLTEIVLALIAVVIWRRDGYPR